MEARRPLDLEGPHRQLVGPPHDVSLREQPGHAVEREDDDLARRQPHARAGIDEPAVTAALQEKRIRGAALDVTVEEPLPASSPLWSMPHVIITPHTGGETVRYEDRVIDLLIENADRLARGETKLVNEIV